MAVLHHAVKEISSAGSARNTDRRLTRPMTEPSGDFEVIVLRLETPETTPIGLYRWAFRYLSPTGVPSIRAVGETRTLDLRITSAPLYRLSYNGLLCWQYSESRAIRQKRRVAAQHPAGVRLGLLFDAGDVGAVTCVHAHDVAFLHEHGHLRAQPCL